MVVLCGVDTYLVQLVVKLSRQVLIAALTILPSNLAGPLPFTKITLFPWPTLALVFETICREFLDSGGPSTFLHLPRKLLICIAVNKGRKLQNAVDFIE